MQRDLPTSRLAGSLLPVVLLTASSSIALAADAKAPDDWRFDAEVYGWAAGIGADLSSSGHPRLAFDRLVDDLDMAFMGVFAASKDKWSVPINLMVKQLVKVGEQRLQLTAGARYWAESPDNIGPHGWGARFEVSFLFPK